MVFLEELSADWDFAVTTEASCAEITAYFFLKILWGGLV